MSNREKQKLNNIIVDLHTLCFGAGVSAADIEDARLNQGSLSKFVRQTRILFEPPDNMRPEIAFNFKPTTSLGRHALVASEKDWSSNVGIAYTSLSGCRDAESKLVQNVRHTTVRNTQKQSPLLVTDGDNVTAIIKTEGEPSIYALVNDADLGLISGTFARPPEIVRSLLALLPGTGHAWTIASDQLQSVLPMRFSAFAIPKAVRAAGVDYPSKASTLDDFDTDTIMQQARRLQEFAKPIPELPFCDTSR